MHFGYLSAFNQGSVSGGLLNPVICLGLSFVGGGFGAAMVTRPHWRRQKSKQLASWRLDTIISVIFADVWKARNRTWITFGLQTEDLTQGWRNAVVRQVLEGSYLEEHCSHPQPPLCILISEKTVETLRPLVRLSSAFLGLPNVNAIASKGSR